MIDARNAIDAHGKSFSVNEGTHTHTHTHANTHTHTHTHTVPPSYTLLEMLEVFSLSFLPIPEQ